MLLLTFTITKRSWYPQKWRKSGRNCKFRWTFSDFWGKFSEWSWCERKDGWLDVSWKLALESFILPNAGDRRMFLRMWDVVQSQYGVGDVVEVGKWILGKGFSKFGCCCCPGWFFSYHLASWWRNPSRHTYPKECLWEELWKLPFGERCVDAAGWVPEEDGIWSNVHEATQRRYLFYSDLMVRNLPHDSRGEVCNFLWSSDFLIF